MRAQDRSKVRIQAKVTGGRQKSKNRQEQAESFVGKQACTFVHPNSHLAVVLCSEL